MQLFIQPLLHFISLSLLLGRQDIRARYRRSVIGPFWLTISMGIMIACIGLIFGKLFNSQVEEFIPFLAAGIIVWGFITGTINEGCTAFIDAERIIKQLSIPLFVHILRVIWRNFFIFLHNILIFPVVFFLLSKTFALTVFLILPGLLLVIMSLSWMALLVAIISTRFRDLPQIIASILQVFFYITPIMWIPSLLKGAMGSLLIQFNPFYHLIELIRAPLIGQVPALMSWITVVSLILLGWLITFLVFLRFRYRIAYWL